MSTVNPGSNYRLLNAGETIQQDDEYLSGGEWHRYTILIGEKFKGCDTARRRVLADWRPLQKGEIIMPGDEFQDHLTGVWHEYRYTIGDIFVGGAFPARRRTNVIDAIPKPPPGVTPKWLHDMQRREALLSAIMRHQHAGKPIPSEWSDEYFSLLPVHAITKVK